MGYSAHFIAGETEAHTISVVWSGSHCGSVYVKYEILSLHIKEGNYSTWDNMDGPGFH